MVSVSSLKALAIGIFKGGKSKQLAKSAAQVSTEAASVEQLKTVVDQPGLRILEQIRGDNLFRYETRVINGRPTSTMQVFEAKGEYIGKGGSEGLAIHRTKTVQVEKGESVFGGDKITIDKNYRETMSMTEHQNKIVKEYSPEGIYEHGEESLKYRHWEQPRITEYNRFTYANGQTPYSEAIEAKKAAEIAQKAEKEALAAAALKAEKEAAAKLAAETPRVNIGKVFGKDLSELKKIQDETLSDGTIVRKYMTKNKNGFSQYIITKDKGSYHEEYIVDTAKNIKIKYTQIGDTEPTITMSKGLQYRQTSKPEPLYTGKAYRRDTQIYNNGRDYVEFDSYGTPGKFIVHTSEGNVCGYREVRDINEYTWKPYAPISKEAVANLNAIQQEAKSEYVNLQDLFKPYEA